MNNPDQAMIEARPRLSTFEAAWVIARRDFVAVLFSRAFLFFLLGRCRVNSHGATARLCKRKMQYNMSVDETKKTITTTPAGTS